jgi:hypothetical protein
VNRKRLEKFHNNFGIVLLTAYIWFLNDEGGLAHEYRNTDQTYT